MSNHLYLSFVVIGMFFVFVSYSFCIGKGLCHQVWKVEGFGKDNESCYKGRSTNYFNWQTMLQ